MLLLEQGVYGDGGSMPVLTAWCGALQHVGMGALYYFASHMVIRAMFHVGVGRTPFEMALFLLVVMGSVSAAHLLSGPLLRLRVMASAYLRFPVVSLLAATGALLELLGILTVTGPAPLYMGGLLVGLACGWLVVIWSSSFHVSAPNAQTFLVSPALLCAVGFYFLFRVASSVSEGLAQGVLFALPLVTIACMTVAEPGRDEDAAEERRSPLVLVCVSASFAVLSSVVVYLAGQEDMGLDSSLNYMTLFEALAVGIMLCCCSCLRWFASQGQFPHLTGIFVALLLVGPGFLVGLAMGFAYEPQDVPGLMWEVSLWVMLVAVFAYDLRRSLYLARGLAVGLMFEAMCMGQMAMQVAAHMGRASWPSGLAIILSVAYLLGVGRQLLTGACGVSGSSSDRPGFRDARMPESAPQVLPLSLAGSEDGGCSAAEPVDVADCSLEDDGSLNDSDALDERCMTLGRQFSLTQSEVAIFAMVARGRSARYIADELGVSFNTVRTHIRHVYEKLGIHSKQELIDLVNKA